MASVSLQSRHTLKPSWADTADTLNPLRGAPSIDASVTLNYDATPTGADEMDRLYSDTLAVTTGGNTLELDTAFSDQVAGATTCSGVKYIWLKNTDDTNFVTVAGDFFTSIFPSCTGLVLQPGMSIQLARPDATGMAVAGGSSDTLTLTADTATCNVQVILAGIG